jgi:hypothetical protein
MEWLDRFWRFPTAKNAGNGPPSRTRPTKYCVAWRSDVCQPDDVSARRPPSTPAFGRIGKRQLIVPVERRRGSMKWNILCGSLVLGLGLCTQSFGFELLDRMLGVDSCCESSCCKKSCCEAAAPSCCAAEPTCAAAAGPACGCDAAPACGCESACAPKCCKQKCRQPLFNFNKCCKPKCCKSACDTGCCDAQPTCAAACEPACGAEPACGCESACAPKCCKSKCNRGCLLDRIFACNKRCCKPKCCDNGCHGGCNGCAAAAPGCGYEGGHGAPAPAMDGDAPPMPPAPVVDPSAFVPSQRRVVHASTLR